MKILILSPFIDAQHNISMRLRASGAALLFPETVDEAWKMIQLHGTSLDLAIINREGASDSIERENNEDGFVLLKKIKADKDQTDLPVIVSSFIWDDIEFAQHQQSKLGANAYLKWPFTDIQLIQTIEAMFGNSIRFASAVETRSDISDVAGVTSATKTLSTSTGTSTGTGTGADTGTIPLSADLLEAAGEHTGSTIALQAGESTANQTINLQPPDATGTGSAPAAAPPS